MPGAECHRHGYRPNPLASVNEWGAGMLDGDLFVGFSRAGCVFVYSDWRKAIRDPAGLAAYSSLIECKSDGSSFDLGGWLSVQNHRLMFEIQDRIYVVALDDRNRIQDANGRFIPCFLFTAHEFCTSVGRPCELHDAV